MYIPVSKLLASDRSGAVAVARIASQDVTFAEFKAEVADLRARLKNRGVTQVVLATESSYAFATGMLAAFDAGCRVTVPPNALPGMLARFVTPDCPLLSDIKDEIHSDDRILIDGAKATEATFRELNPDACSLDFYTSGSTGEPKRVPKSLAQIENELTVLDQVFGAWLGAAATLGTVSHQHIFGLYFKCLLPLSEGRLFFPETFEIWEELLAFAPPGACIVSSPAHLTRIPPLDPLPTSAQAPVIFTAGGPLPFEAAQTSARMFGPLPTEIYGSTETGGIAHRQQERATTPFRPLPGMETRVDGQGSLWVKSNYTDNGDWDKTNDIAELFPDGSFLLAGRANQFVKIEGKRISLAEIEKFLTASDLVKDAAVLVLTSPRDTLAAVAELTKEGWRRHAEIGAFRLGRILRKELSPNLENAALPRRWRFVDRLPVNSQGKRQQAALHELFAGGEGAD